MEKVICAGWIKKRSSSIQILSYFQSPRYLTRYLVLSTSRLVYYNQLPTDQLSLNEEDKHIVPLNSIISINKGSSDSTFSIITENQNKTLLVLCETDPERDEWVKNIQDALEAKIATDSLLNNSDPYLSSDVAGSVENAVNDSSRTSSTSDAKPTQRSIDKLFSNVSSLLDSIKTSGMSVLDNITHSIIPNEADASINETVQNAEPHKHIEIPKFNKHMINLVCMLELKMARLSYKSLFHVIDLFYEKIERSQHKLKKQRAKEIGQCLVLWLGNNDIWSERQRYEHKENELFTIGLISKAEYECLSTSQKLLYTWLEYSLLKEFQIEHPLKSDIDPDSFHIDDIPKDISPFRIDKIETLIISNIIRASCCQSKSLNSWLSTALLCIEQSPEDFILPEMSTESEQSSILNENKNKQRDRDSVVLNKFNLCLIILEKISQQIEYSQQFGTSSSTILPSALQILFYSIRRLVLKELEHTDTILTNSQTPIDSAHETSKDPDYSRILKFHTAMTAILFLRLICPALIDPENWGLLSSWKSESKSPESYGKRSEDLQESVDVAERNMNIFLGAAPFLVILSHIICETSILDEDNGSNETYNTARGLHETNPEIIPLMQEISKAIPIESALSLLELKRLDHFKPTKVDLSSADSNLFSQGKNSNFHEQNSNNEIFTNEHWEWDKKENWIIPNTVFLNTKMQMQDSGVTSRNRSSSADRDIEMRFASKNIRKALIEVTKYLQQAANASANHFQINQSVLDSTSNQVDQESLNVFNSKLQNIYDKISKYPVL